MAPQPPQLCRDLCAVLCVVLMAAAQLVPGTPLSAQSSGAPGGFVEHAASTSMRTALTAAQIQSFLPARGRFRFPAPYNTEGIRLTNASDCGGGDCVLSVGYSYWQNINNHTGSDTMLIVLGLERRLGGGGPTLFSYSKSTGATQNLGPLFPATSVHSWASGEGWYFSATNPTMLYLQDGPKMLRYDVSSRVLSTVFDATSAFGANRYIWQTHTSQDDRVHSFTLRDTGTSAMLGCGAYLESSGQFRFYPARQDYDECQIDRSGRFLVIKDNIDGLQGEDNVIIDLTTGLQQVLHDPEGAGGHSDAGYGYQVAEDNWHPKPGAARVWNLAGNPGDGSQGRLVFHVTDWNFGSIHIAHGNSRAGLPLDQQVACMSSLGRTPYPRNNEVLCYRLDGSLQVLVAAPVMTNIDASGGGPDPYWKLPKGNIDVTGEYFIWASNMGGSRQDVFIVRLPTQLLFGGAPAPAPPPSSPTPAPAPAPAPEPAPAPAPSPTLTGTAAPVTWTSLVNTVVVGEDLRKVNGCSGCPDAGAASAEQLTSGDGYVEFPVSDSNSGRWLGLSRGNPGTSTGEIAYALRLGGGYVEVRESGVYRADIGISSGDVLRVEVAGGRVFYKKNGTTFYASGATPVYPLLVDTSFSDLNASLTRVVFAGSGASGGGTAPAPDPAPAPSNGSTLTWTNLRNVSVEGDLLRKTGGCFGCADATAVSAETFTAGSYLEFAAVDGGLAAIGFTRKTAPVLKDFDFAIRLNNGFAEVRENGVARATSVYHYGDVFRITVANGKVTYTRNGTPFRSSPAKSFSASRAGALLFIPNGFVQAPVTQ